MPLINVKELERQYRAEPERCVAMLRENMEPREEGGRPVFRPDDFSFRDLFIALHPQGRGRELLYEINFAKSGGNALALREAADYVSSGDFSNITGQIYFNKLKEGYNDPDLIGDQLCTVVPTEFINGERIPYVGDISPSLLQNIGEGQEYPLIGLNEDWTDTPATVKHGAIIGFTRESLVMDRTGLELQKAAKIGKAAAVEREKEIIDVATMSNGATTLYNRDGVYTQTFLTSGAYINDQTGNALDGEANEWRALEKADLLFDAMTDPNTGEPIGIPKSPQLLVPSALLRTAERIVRATSVDTVDMRQQATTIRTTGDNPYAARRPQILSNQYVKARTGSTSYWYYGDFKKAIYWMQVWAIETLDAIDNAGPNFERDIWGRKKVSYRGRATMVEPRFLTRNNT